MRIIRTIKQIRSAVAAAKGKKKKIGFVPTMGALHQGHVSLLDRCRRQNGLAVMSIFVNPLQFGPREDFSRYPRRKKEDISLAQKAKIDIIFAPTAAEMYPNNFLTSIDVNDITSVMCGASRPGHFKGVTTVVGKLLNIVTPDVLYLGQKDGQQVAVIKKMIGDLNIPVSVSVCPTVRENDGLAMSSRNIYLSAEERKEAPILFTALRKAKKRIQSGEKNPSKIISLIRQQILKHSSAKIDYIVCVEADTLSPVNRLEGKIMVALAAWFSRTRLIDNIIVRAK